MFKIQQNLAPFLDRPTHYGTKPGRYETSNHSLSHEIGSEQVSGAGERAKGAGERAKGRASSPVPTSGSLADVDHSTTSISR